MIAKSIKGNSIEVINAALRESMEDGYKPTLAFIFITELKDIDTVAALFDAEGIAIFGASTSEKFTEQGIESEGIVALLLDINPANFLIVLKDFEVASAYRSACEVGEAGKQKFDHPAFIISGADFTTPGEDVIKGLLEKAGNDTKIMGGMAGEAVNFTATVFTNNAKSSRGFVSLILDEDKIDVKGMAVSGWKPVGTEKKITQCDGPWIRTIDDEPAMDVVQRFLGKEIASTEKAEGVVPVNIMENYPLQVQRESGIPVMRPMLLWNTEDQSVMVGGLVKEGPSFRFSLPPDLEVIDMVVESCEKIRETELPEADAMIVFSCVGRLSSLGPMITSELDGLAAIWNKPMAGFFSLGEFGKVDDSQPEFHGTTVSWVALKEK